MVDQINLKRVQDLWNCGYTDEEMLEIIKGGFNLKDIERARDEIGLYKNYKNEEQNIKKI